MNGDEPAVQFTKTEEAAKTPTYAHTGDTGADLCCLSSFALAPGEIVGAKTGLCVAFPPGYGGQVRSKSGLALKGLSVIGGVIDNAYRGEIVVILQNTGKMAQYFTAGDKVGQLVLERVEQAHFLEVSKLPDLLPGYDRGAAGFGSTGR